MKSTTHDNLLARTLQRMMQGEKFSAVGLHKELQDDASLDVKPSESTVRRWLDALEEEIECVVKTKERPAKYGFEWPNDAVSSRDTLLALQLARSLLVLLRGSKLDHNLLTVIDEHQNRLPLGQRGVVHNDRMFFTKTRTMIPVVGDAALLDQIVQAIDEQRIISASYFEFDGWQDAIELKPYSVVFGDEGLYCYGLCIMSAKPKHIGKLRLYHIARLEEVIVTEKRFTYPHKDEYDPASSFKHSFGIFLGSEDGCSHDVVAEFDPRWKSYLERHRWHESQSAPDVGDDGWCRVKFHVYLTTDLMRWILHFGKQVRVVEPSSLKKWVESGGVST